MRKSLEHLKFEMIGLIGKLDSTLDTMNTSVISTLKTLSPEEKINLYSKVSKDFSNTSLNFTTTVRTLKNRLEEQ